jgi:hypothetical protein
VLEPVLEKRLLARVRVRRAGGLMEVSFALSREGHRLL